MVARRSSLLLLLAASALLLASGAAASRVMLADPDSPASDVVAAAAAAASAEGGGPAPPEALLDAKLCVCPRGTRQALTDAGCACECDSGYQGSRAAKKKGCTLAFPNNAAAADKACKCVRCPAGTTSGGGDMNVTQCSPPPRQSGDGGVSVQNTITIPYNMQCGGRGSTPVNGWPGCGTTGRQCWDAPWSGVTCTAGTACVRSNEWWWFCNWSSTGTVSKITVPDYAQCGGRSTTATNGWPGCGTAGRECVDAPWSGTTCQTGRSCVRSNEWWWGCQPTTTNPCAGRTCSGRGTCSGGVCTCQAGWTGTNCETQVTTSSGCPAGWERAVGTLYDSWPKPGTKECVEFSGCKWAGLFSRISAGPLFSAQPVCNANLCATRTWAGVNYRAQCLAGDQRSFEVACRWPESAVRAWRMAATWDQDSALLGSSLEVMVEGVPSRTTRVNVQDVCNDNDCNGCCRQNTGNGAYKLIDLEKWPALDLLGNFDPSSPTFDINNVVKPLAFGRRPGARENSVMPLCYRRV